MAQEDVEGDESSSSLSHYDWDYVYNDAQYNDHEEVSGHEDDGQDEDDDDDALIHDGSSREIVCVASSVLEDGSNVNAEQQVIALSDTYKQWTDRVAVLGKEEADPSPQGRRLELYDFLFLPTLSQSSRSRSEKAASTPTPPKQVMLHSLTTDQTMNGRVGELVGYMGVTKDRFVVKLLPSGKLVSMKPQNLRLVTVDKNKDDKNDSQSQNQSRDGEESSGRRMTTTEKFVSALFMPGMLFRGTIQIPGLQQSGRREYRLIVDSQPSTMDETGRQPTGILARHGAYDDEQYVWIYVETTAGRPSAAEEEKNANNDDEDDDNDEETETDVVLSIRYADSETQCRGTWNPNKAQFEGTVRQLLPTEDAMSVYHTQEVTHTFTLSPVVRPSGITAPALKQIDDKLSNHLQENCAIADFRAKTDALLLGLVDQFKELNKAVTSWSAFVSQQESNDSSAALRALHSMSKGKFLTHLLMATNLAAEKTCAILRRRSELLENLSFASPQDKAATLADLKAKGVSRAHAHAEIDELQEVARIGCGATSSISSLLGHANARLSGADIVKVMILSTRLDKAFGLFDDSLRRAEERMTETDIAAFTFQLPEAQSSDEKQPTAASEEFLCAICHVDFDVFENKDVEVLCLPCRHMFHEECIRKWLHNHAHCPVCRLDLRRRQQQNKE